MNVNALAAALAVACSVPIPPALGHNEGAVHVEHEVAVKCRGRFRAIKHTGHTFDELGNVVKYGDVIEETPFGDNKITLTGFNRMLGRAPASGGSGSMGSVIFVAGSGNTTPAESQSTLVSYVGKTNTHVSTTTTRNVTPDGSGNVMWRVTMRVTFNPGSLGTGSKNIAEAGIVMEGISIGSVNGSTLVGARGLLVDGGGSPTTVSVNADVEYLDLIWEYTEWIPASVTGTVSLTIDGATVVHDYEVRPCWFENTGGSYNNRGWQNMGALTGPALSATRTVGTYDKANANTVALEGPLGALYGANPGGTYADANMPVSMTLAAYTTDSKYRDVTMVWTPLYGNVAGGIGAVRVHMGHSQWQVSYSPKIAKINTKQLNLTFRITMANL